MLSNDQANPQPTTTFSGPTLEFDFPGLEIGVAEYAEGPTGCTVFCFPNGALTAVDMRGGAVGTTGNYDWNHAICLAGGSLYGLEAASGAAAELFARRKYTTKFEEIVLVSGAIVYDFGSRANAIYPDKALGRAAVSAARAGSFPLGQRGAGCSTSVGKLFDRTRSEPGGQGGAFAQIGVTKILACTVVNAIGALVNRQGQVVRGNLDRQTGLRQASSDDLQRRLAEAQPSEPARGNTTLTVIITNQKLSSGALTQLGRQVHSSMARAIQPFHTVFDGDTLYAVTTNAVENPQLSETALGIVASELAWDAVLTLADT
jgi:6-aminohexanoate-oligomer endohydrolase